MFCREKTGIFFVSNFIENFFFSARPARATKNSRLSRLKLFYGSDLGHSALEPRFKLKTRYRG